MQYKQTVEEWTSKLNRGYYDQFKHTGARHSLQTCVDLTYETRRAGLLAIDSRIGKGPVLSTRRGANAQVGCSNLETFTLNLELGYYKTLVGAVYAAGHMHGLHDLERRQAKERAHRFFQSTRRAYFVWLGRLQEGRYATMTAARRAAAKKDIVIDEKVEGPLREYFAVQPQQELPLAAEPPTPTEPAVPVREKRYIIILPVATADGSASINFTAHFVTCSAAKELVAMGYTPLPSAPLSGEPWPQHAVLIVEGWAGVVPKRVERVVTVEF